MASPTSKIMFVVFILGLILPNTLATQYDVCGDLGWTIGADVSLWLNSLPIIKVGDIFIFKFQFPHTVALVDATAYLNCDASKAIINDISGMFSFTFTKAGLYSFISAAAGDCAAGLKLQVLVVL